MEHELDSNLLYIDGYSFERLDRSVVNSDGTAKSGGGICVYIADRFTYRVLDEMTRSNSNIEVLTIRVSL